MIWPLANLIEFTKVIRIDRNFPKPEPGAEHAIGVPAETANAAFDRLARRAVEVAASEIGRGEEGGDNRGPDVIRYCGCDNVFWCAGFVGWCYQRAAEDLGMALPFRRSLGAKRLGERVAAVGRKFKDARQARAGDLVVWHRGKIGSPSGHVGLVERIGDEYSITTLEGNSGPRVRRRHHDLSRERLAFFASLRSVA